jgi:predicted transposase YbfD/YdcC
LAQLSVPEKTNEITAIPELLDQLADRQLAGALVSIDAMGVARPQGRLPAFPQR